MKPILTDKLDKSSLTDSMQTESEGPVEKGKIDCSLVEHNLSLSYEERIEAHEAARELMADLRKAGKAYDEEQS